MRRLRSSGLAALLFPSIVPLACGSGDTTSALDAGAPDARPHDSRGPDIERSESGPGSPTASNITHLVVVVQENHSFDNYFGRYCTAATGSNPTCNAGPSCCERGPAKDAASGDSPVTQDDAQNAGHDPSHTQACELTEIDDGKMDGYVTSPTCGDVNNFAYADAASVKTYWDLAGKGALADRYFQPIAGASTANDMYLATASYVFTDDDFEPVAIGASCTGVPEKSFTGMTIADLLVAAKVPWGWFGQGYLAMSVADKAGKCATDPRCPAGAVAGYPCVYDPGDDPFLYFARFADNPKYILDYTELAKDLGASSLPAVSYVKAVGYRTEHPGSGDTISAGEAFVSGVVDAVQASPYGKDTLVLVTWDESGGFYDHIAPPAESTIDHQPYGPRVPLLAVGAFAKKNYVSHVPMEHSSIVKFIEWNWLGSKTGQLGKRDTTVNNIGDMLDPTQTGTTVPAH